MNTRSGCEYIYNPTNFWKKSKIPVKMAGGDNEKGSSSSSQNQVDATVTDALKALTDQVGQLTGTMMSGVPSPADLHHAVVTGLTDHDKKKEKPSKKPPQSILNLFQPEIFTGDKSEDSEEFLEQFFEFAEQANFSAINFRALMTRFLKGPALSWFKELDGGKTDSREHLEEAFKAKYGTVSLSYAEKQIILYRQHKPEEDIETYAHELNVKFKRCSTPLEEQLHLFLKGLQAPLRAKVLDKECVSLAAAVEEAKRLQNLQRMAQGYDTDAITMIQGLTNTINKITEKSIAPTEDERLRDALSKLLKPTPQTETKKSQEASSNNSNNKQNKVRKVNRGKKIMVASNRQESNRPTCTLCQSDTHGPAQCVVLKQLVQEAAGPQRAPEQTRSNFRPYRPMRRYGGAYARPRAAPQYSGPPRPPNQFRPPFARPDYVGRNTFRPSYRQGPPRSVPSRH